MKVEAWAWAGGGFWRWLVEIVTHAAGFATSPAPISRPRRKFLGSAADPPHSARPVDEPYRIKLDIFEGPLDLLLYLIKKEELDIYDIPIGRITGQYFDYLNTFKLLNIELASEFVLMAATLMYIKSRMLLPKPVQPPEDEAEDDDPRWDLVRQLVEYRKFKDAAGFLALREGEQGRWFAARPEPPLPPDPVGPEEVQVSIFDLIRAFRKVLRRFEDEHSFGIIHDEPFTVAQKIDFLLDALQPGEDLPFESLFEGAASRGELIVTFLAILELMKLNQFQVRQPEPLGPIVVHRKKIP
jgi:segregation and condensation protein A